MSFDQTIPKLPEKRDSYTGIKKSSGELMQELEVWLNSFIKHPFANQMLFLKWFLTLSVLGSDQEFL
jgi:hypothetical protein